MEHQLDKIAKSLTDSSGQDGAVGRRGLVRSALVILGATITTLIVPSKARADMICGRCGKCKEKGRCAGGLRPVKVFQCVDTTAGRCRGQFCENYLEAC